MDFGQAIAQGFHSFFMGGITLVGVATIAGYIFERQSDRPGFITNWRVRDLGFFEITRLDSEGFDRALNSGAGAPSSVRAMSGRSMSPLARALSSAVAVAVLTAWWIGAIRFGGVPLNEWVVEFAGVDYSQAVQSTVAMIFWPVVAYGGSRVVFDLFRAANPRAVRMTAVGDIALAAARLVGFGWLLFLSPLGHALGVTDIWSVVERIRDTVQTGISTGVWSLSGVIVLILGSMLLEPVGRIIASIWRFVTGRDRRLER